MIIEMIVSETQRDLRAIKEMDSPDGIDEARLSEELDYEARIGKS